MPKSCNTCDEFRCTSLGKWCHLLTIRADSSELVLDPTPDMCDPEDYQEKRDTSWRVGDKIKEME